MSEFTTQLRWPVEQLLKDQKLPPTESNWPKIYNRLGLDDYPIFDEGHREVLNNKIIRHYFMREIGLETLELFRYFMRMKMWEIMPYYNQLYKSELIEFDPLSTRDMKCDEKWTVDNTDDWTVDNTRDQTDDWTRKENGTLNSNTTADDREVFQDTPMSMLDSPGSNPVSNLEYATTVTYDHGTTGTDQTTSSTGSGKNTADEKKKETGDRDKNEDGAREKHDYGYDIPGADMLQKYRETFLNIDMMIIRELADLFMGIG